MTLSPVGLQFLMTAEGFCDHVYDDAGHPAIGYGCDLTPEQAQEFNGKTISKDDAQAMLLGRIYPIEKALPGLVTVPLTQGQYDACCSFAYNLGIGALSRSLLLVKLNRGDVKGAAEEFLRWDHIGGAENPGLKARRQGERAMFLQPVPNPIAGVTS